MDSCQYMAKPIQHCKVISLQLKKNYIIKYKKKKTEFNIPNSVLGCSTFFIYTSLNMFIAHNM